MNVSESQGFLFLADFHHLVIFWGGKNWIFFSCGVSSNNLAKLLKLFWAKCGNQKIEGKEKKNTD